jgi:1,4-alpha-glucan branching enzyme
MNKPEIVHIDPWLEPFAGVISRRKEKIENKIKELSPTGKLIDFATGHLYFGIHKEKGEWVIREWAPNAVKICLIGTFNNWNEIDCFQFKQLENGVWELRLALIELNHMDLYKLRIFWEGGQGDRIPAWATRVVQDPETLIFNAQVWAPDEAYNWKNHTPSVKNETPLIYEAHVGMATEEYNTGTYEDFRTRILPRVKKSGYNVLQLMAIQEHPYYGSFGYHVSNFFAPSSRFGSPDELKALIDEAHGMGIRVIMDLVHSHAVKNELEGLGNFDGTPWQYFHDGPRRNHVAWDSLCFNYSKNEVIHFLLSNIHYWLKEFHFDGFRFDGVTSMLYYDHGLNIDFNSYEMYFNGAQDEDAIVYLGMANKICQESAPNTITIAEEMSGYPGLAAPLDWGGLGFGYRMAMGTPDYWIKLIKEKADEDWNMEEMFYELTRKRPEEKTVGYAESHDQALVGDKTIIFRLMDKEMYFSMSKNIESLIIDRGIALHKMIRLITLSTAGNAYLNFMGNEFGHPEWIDFPREGNNWSYHYARRQWSLMDNPDLRYHYLVDFDRAMIKMAKESRIFSDGIVARRHINTGDMVLAYERANLLFIFNFHPVKSYPDYGISCLPGKYKAILTSDSIDFGGQERIDLKLSYRTVPEMSFSPNQMLKIYLPSRTAVVLERIKIKSVY